MENNITNETIDDDETIIVEPINVLNTTDINQTDSIDMKSTLDNTAKRLLEKPFNLVLLILIIICIIVLIYFKLLKNKNK